MDIQLSKLLLKNRLFFSMVLFSVLFYAVIIIKPNFIFDNDGSFREFGVGNTAKTVIPIWLFVLFISFVSYYAIHYIIIYPKIKV
jgi:sterol desaturase/sphingolipid hydroxylase (fatty acid hydroxylase superfamily)